MLNLQVQKHWKVMFAVSASKKSTCSGDKITTYAHTRDLSREIYIYDFPRNGFFTRLPREFLTTWEVKWMSGKAQPNRFSEIAHEWLKN